MVVFLQGRPPFSLLLPFYFSFIQCPMKFFIQALIVFALVSAGISPACNFINGSDNGWIQICASDGTVKKVKVDAGQLPFAQEGEEPESQEHMALDDCAFCFSHTHGKSLAALDVSISNPIQYSYLKVSSGTFAPKSLNAHTYQPRAPPVFS